MQLELGRARVRAFGVPALTVSSRVMSLAATLAVGLGVFAVYLTTLAPTVMWYDMGEFATTSATLGIAHNTGYPLLILTGKLFTFLPVGDVAYRVNLMSALFTALAIAVVFGIIHDLTDDILASAIGALTLAFGSTVWANATWATSYGMNLFFTALVTRFMLSWWRDRSTASLTGAALAFGLGMCNHRLIVLVAPPSLMLLALGWRSLTWRTCALAGGAFLLGLVVYLYLPIRGAQEPALSWARPANWHTYASMFLNGQTPSAYWRIDLRDRVDVLWSYPSYDLTWAGLALAGVGLGVCAARARAVAAYMVVLLVLDAVVVETYSIHNIYNYLTPGHFALAVLIGVAAAWIIDVVRRADTGAVGAGVRVVAISVLLALLPVFLLAKNHARVDRSSDYAAYDFAQTTLDRMPPGAVILTDTWAAPPLWYLQFVRGERRDVIVSPIFSVPGEDAAAFARARLDEGRSVYAAEGLRTPLDGLAQQFALAPVLLDGIEEMTTNVLPKPQFRDDLVATGSLYRLRDGAPDDGVAAVEHPLRAAQSFANGVTLAGYASDADVVDRGNVAELTYEWRAESNVEHDLRAVTLFFDEHGQAQQVRGFPTWSQSRLIGQGRLQTSKWKPGSVYRESYYVLVPRTVSPGRYDVKLAVYDPDGDGAAATADAHHLTPIGSLTVR